MDIAQYQGLTVFVAGGVISLALWMLRSHILQVVDGKVDGLARTSSVAALDERVDAQDRRIASMETALRHLPTADQMHALTLVVSDLRGEVRSLKATLEGMEKVAAATGRRVELIDEHLKRSA